jgi:hypothetical protein
MEVSFHIYSVGIRVSTNDELFAAVLKNLKEDFCSFVHPGTDAYPALEIELRDSAGISPKRGAFLFRNQMCSVYGWGEKRVCDYGHGAWTFSKLGKLGSVAGIDGAARVQSRNRRIEVFSGNAQDSYELAYLAILSVSGEELDKKRLHRVHALGFDSGERSGLLVLPSGGGKSAIGALLLKNQSWKIYSDETPLLQGQIVHPFPLRLALKPHIASALGLEKSERVFARRRYGVKSLFPIPVNRVAKAKPLNLILIGRKMGRERSHPGIRRCSRLRGLIGLWESMVVGLGVAQISEHMLRFDSVFDLLGIAFSRLGTAVLLIRNCDIYLFEYDSDANRNADALVSFFASPEVARDTSVRPRTSKI